MLNIDLKTFENVNFSLYGANPVLRRFGLSLIVADPSVLTPLETHDHSWRLFCHTLFGVNMFKSTDGINWQNQGKILDRAMRADVSYIDGTYYLYYERVQPLLKKALTLVGGKWQSQIYLTTSKDLATWSKPKLVIDDTKEYMHDNRGSAISNPFLTKIDGKYRLYFSAGQTFIYDCGFCEPTYISYAESDSPDGEFMPLDKPILCPDKSSNYLNLCCGCIKVYQLKDGYIAFQNGIYLGDDGKSHSAIMLLKSVDGVKFEFVKQFLCPQVVSGKNKDWMKQFVYACNLTYYNGEFRLYFNARNSANMLKGREHIGVYVSK